MKNISFTVYIERDEDGVYIGSVPSIPSCHAQGNTQGKMLKNLREVLRLCLRNTDKDIPTNTKFISTKNLEISHAQTR